MPKSPLNDEQRFCHRRALHPQYRCFLFAVSSSHSKRVSHSGTPLEKHEGALGPGTITYDFIYGAHLTELERLDERLGSAIEHQQRLNDAYNAGVE